MASGRKVLFAVSGSDTSCALLVAHFYCDLRLFILTRMKEEKVNFHPWHECATKGCYLAETSSFALDGKVHMQGGSRRVNEGDWA